GSATGPPVRPNLGTQSDCVPLVQLGYFRHFGDSDWLWGVKYSYSYQDKTLAVDNLVVPQSGTTAGANVPTFPGFSVTRSYDVFMDHQMILVPFVGRSFKNGYVYAGAGPSLSRVGASLNDVVGFASLPGAPPPLSSASVVDISGRPQSDSQSE